MADDLLTEHNVELARHIKWLADNGLALDQCDIDEEIGRLQLWSANYTRAREAQTIKLTERAARPEAPKRVRKNKQTRSREWYDDRNAERKWSREQKADENARRVKWDADNLGACDQDEVDEEQTRRTKWDADFVVARQAMIDEARVRRRATTLRRMKKYKLEGKRAAWRTTLWAYRRKMGAARKTAAANPNINLEVYDTQGEAHNAERRWRFDTMKRAEQIAAERLSYKMDKKPEKVERDDIFWEEATRYIVGLYEKVGDIPPLADLQEQIGFQLS
jgi:hypothetical protein